MAKQPGSPQGNLGGWFGLIVIVLLGLAGIDQCSKKTPSASESAASNFSSSTGNAIASQSPIPIEALKNANLDRGRNNMRAVMKSEGLSGAMIFSQNCYEGLTHQFSWPRLDLCGAADLVAMEAADDALSSQESEAAYFSSETIAGRYLAAATGAGLEASAADQRLELLQSRGNTASKSETSKPSNNASQSSWNAETLETDGVSNDINPE